MVAELETETADFQNIEIRTSHHTFDVTEIHGLQAFSKLSQSQYAGNQLFLFQGQGTTDITKIYSTSS